MVSYVHQPSSPRHVSFMPIPVYSRQCHDDELYVMKAFEKHASHCQFCFDPLATFQSRSTLCAKGHARAIDVSKYVYSKEGLAYSLVDRKAHQRVRLEIPATLTSVKGLLRAWERGLELLQPVKREKTYESAPRKEKPEKTRPPKIVTSPRQPAHYRTGSNSSSDYDYIYSWDNGYTTSPTYYSYPEASYQQSPRRTPVMYRVAPGSPTAQRYYP